MIVPGLPGEGPVAGRARGGGPPRRASVMLRRAGAAIFLAIATVGWAALILGWGEMVADWVRRR
jgi:hypothetical protein